MRRVPKKVPRMAPARVPPEYCPEQVGPEACCMIVVVACRATNTGVIGVREETVVGCGA